MVQLSSLIGERVPYAPDSKTLIESGLDVSLEAHTTFMIPKGMDPMKNTDKINIPILIYHGDYDVRVPIFHSRDFYNAIKNKQPGSKFIEMKQMGHQSNKWLPEHKEQVLKEIETFLNTTCGM